MIVRADFDGGNILVHDAGTLGIRPDTGAPEFRQWFSFRVHDAEPGTLSIVDLASTTYPGAWEGYDVCASFDGQSWFRAPTELAEDALVFEVPEAPLVHFAYFAPYDLDRHYRLVGEAPDAVVIGKTVQRRDLHVVTIGDGPLDLWVIARQHPGETMAEWFVEGMMDRLLDDDEPIAEFLRERATLHLIPNMNPDGSFLGNLRANAAGMNLNRAWLEPDARRSPEVLAVRRRMEQTGVDLFLDIHGDEQNPYCFLAGCEGNPSYSERLRDLENLFEHALLEHNDDFQDEYGYERDEPGGGDLRTAGNWVGERFDCLSLTLEMPFKDASNNPNPARGFSPERARRLGASTLDAIAATLDELRAP